jgi:hypothetical protein
MRPLRTYPRPPPPGPIPAQTHFFLLRAPAPPKPKPKHAPPNLIRRPGPRGPVGAPRDPELDPGGKVYWAWTGGRARAGAYREFEWFGGGSRRGDEQAVKKIVSVCFFWKRAHRSVPAIPSLHSYRPALDSPTSAFALACLTLLLFFFVNRPHVVDRVELPQSFGSPAAVAVAVFISLSKALTKNDHMHRATTTTHLWK